MIPDDPGNPHRRPRRVAVLADTDSRWKWGMLTARELEPTAGCDAYLLAGPSAPSSRQLAEAGVDPARVTRVDGASFVESIRSRTPDVVVLALPGGGCQALLHALSALWPAPSPRPVVVTGYVGVVYEKLVEGLLLRAGSDVVLANSPHDAERFRDTYRAVGADPGSIVETTLPFLGATGTRVLDPRPFTVTFAGQPGVPGPRNDRAYVIRRLVGHARRFPEREVLIKLRSLPGERVTHPEPYPYSELLGHVEPDPPKNLTAVHGSMGEVLDRTDLLVTVSSTAALEAMHRGIPTMVLTDFGIREPLGNPYFVGSGALASFDALDDGHVPATDAGWAAEHGVAGRDTPEFRERVSALLEQESLPPLRPYYSAPLSPVYLPRLLARFGFDPHGLPLAPTDDQGEVRRFVRHAIRSTARTVYHQGVNRVAPALRRLGSL